MKFDIHCFIEIDPVPAEKFQLAGCSQFRYQRFRCARFNQLWLFPAQPQHNGSIRTVPLACVCQRTEKFDPHLRNRTKLALVLNLQGKSPRGNHRSDGMRARWPNSDFEDLKETRHMPWKTTVNALDLPSHSL